jgi:hypothetical protein
LDLEGDVAVGGRHLGPEGHRLQRLRAAEIDLPRGVRVAVVAVVPRRADVAVVCLVGVVRHRARKCRTRCRSGGRHVRASVEARRRRTAREAILVGAREAPAAERARRRAAPLRFVAAHPRIAARRRRTARRRTARRPGATARIAAAGAQANDMSQNDRTQNSRRSHGPSILQSQTVEAARRT